MAAEFIDDTLDGSGQFPTKIPGYEDAADIQEALRLYHYGANTIPATPTQINPKSIAGYLKQLQTNIDNSAVDQSLLAGVGIDWNTQTEQFDIDSTVATKSYVGHSINTITKTSAFTLDLQDANKTILLSTSSSMTLTIPSNSSVAIPIGYQFHFIEIGSGRTTFSPASGVTVGSKNSQLFLDGTYSKGTLVKIATDSWVLYGDVYEGVASTTTTAAPVVTTTTAAPVVTTTTGAPPSFPFFAPATTTTVAPPVTTTTTVAPPVTTTTTVAPPVTTTTTVAPNVSFTTLPYETNVTHNSFTINWAGSNVGSWKVMSAGTGVVYGSGNGAGGSFTRTGLTPSTTYTQTVYLYSGANQTGTHVSDAITVSTNMDPASTYWATGCCSTTNSQVIGDSSVGTQFAISDMNSRCSGGTVTGIQTGYATAVPSINCTPATTTTVAPTTTTVAPTTTTVAPTTTTAAPTETTYYACCTNGAGVSGTYANSSAAVTGLNAACNTNEPGIGNTTQGGVYTTPQSCNPPTPTTTTVAPTTTTVAPTTTTAAPTTTTAAPAAFGITGTSSTSTSVTAYWANSPALTAWYEYSVGGTTLTTSSTSATVSGLLAATSYTFTVRAKNSSNSTLASDSITIITTTPSATTTTVAPTTTTPAPVVTTTTPAPVVTTTTPAPVVTTTTPAPVVTTTTPAPVVTTTTSAPVVTTTTTTAAPTGFRICTSLDVANSFCFQQGCDSGGCGNGNSCSVGQNRCSAQ
jgi:hypothetical protein